MLKALGNAGKRGAKGGTGSSRPGYQTSKFHGKFLGFHGFHGKFPGFHGKSLVSSFLVWICRISENLIHVLIFEMAIVPFVNSLAGVFEKIEADELFIFSAAKYCVHIS